MEPSTHGPNAPALLDLAAHLGLEDLQALSSSYFREARHSTDPISDTGTSTWTSWDEAEKGVLELLQDPASDPRTEDPLVDDLILFVVWEVTERK